MTSKTQHRPAITRRGQPYYDQEIVKQHAVKPAAAGVAAALGNPVPHAIREVVGTRRVRLDWSGVKSP